MRRLALLLVSLLCFPLAWISWILCERFHVLRRFDKLCQIWQSWPNMAYSEHCLLGISIFSSAVGHFLPSRLFLALCAKKYTLKLRPTTTKLSLSPKQLKKQTGHQRSPTQLTNQSSPQDPAGHHEQPYEKAHITWDLLATHHMLSELSEFENLLLALQVGLFGHQVRSGQVKPRSVIG